MSIYLKPKVLYIGLPNQKYFFYLSHYCLRFEFRLINIKNWHCLFWRMYVSRKNYKRVLKFFKYIYQDQGLHISASRMILSWKEKSLERKSFVGVNQES